MVSLRRSAHLGVSAAVILLTLSLGVLIALTPQNLAPRAAVAGEAAPAFVLLDAEGRTFSSQQLNGRYTVLYFTSARCPFANEITPRVIDLARQYANDDRIAFVAIDSNVTSASGETADEIRVQNKVIGQNYPTLLDDQGSVCRDFGATITPEFFIIDPHGVIRYRGSFDDNRYAAQVKQHYVDDALKSLLKARPVPTVYTQAFGCLIKRSQ